MTREPPSGRCDRREFLRRSAAAALAAGVPAPFGAPSTPRAGAAERRLLHVAVPGVRNYVEWGGVGVLLYDVDDGHRLVRRIPTLTPAPGGAAENVKGICASAATGRLYVSTPQRLLCLDLLSGDRLWNRELDGGCDRMAITPDGGQLYTPAFEGPHWNVVDGGTGDVLARIEVGSGSHNTIVAPDGSAAYLAGLRSPTLAVADTRTRRVVRGVGPFGAPIRPFTIDVPRGLCFVNVNGLLGFEVGDLRSGRALHRVEVRGFHPGPLKRHGCPSHGIGLTPDGGELWVADGANSHVHVFDARTMPPRQVASIRLRDQPGWVTFGLDGRYAYPSTGEVVDTRTRRIVARLADEHGAPVQSEKLLEVVTVDGKPTRVGDQFGIGRGPAATPATALLPLVTHRGEQLP